MSRTISAIVLAAAAIFSVAAGCGEVCTAGATRCSDGQTMQVCSNPSGVIGSGASGNEWHDVPCVDVNPYCVVMAGGATCVASPTTTDKCPDAGPATWVCTGDAGETPAFCNQGFLQNSPVSCNPPASYCTLIDAGAYCALDGGGPAPGDAGVD